MQQMGNGNVSGQHPSNSCKLFQGGVHLGMALVHTSCECHAAPSSTCPPHTGPPSTSSPIPPRCPILRRTMQCMVLTRQVRCETCKLELPASFLFFCYPPYPQKMAVRFFCF